MNSDHYEAKEDARSDFLAENCENLEENFDFFLDILLILNFDVTTLRKD